MGKIGSKRKVFGRATMQQVLGKQKDSSTGRQAVKENDNGVVGSENYERDACPRQ